MSVLLYQDYKFDKGLLFNRLNQYFGNNYVFYCDAQEINEGILDENVELLVMPGGADLYYCEKLDGQGCESIRSYIKNGGRYLGICAGAYFACKNIEWAKGQTNEICGSRELKFFNGTAIGPIYEFIEKANFTKSWQAATKISLFDGTNLYAHYEAGPVFYGSDCKILAHFSDLPNNPAAIIESKIGKGLIILSSLHIENTSNELIKKLYHHNNSSYEWESSVIEKIKKSDKDIEKLWSIILKRLCCFNHEK